jgi:peptidyl-prolyl cis-trans isomerase A (cyclophilin A)
LIFLVSLRARRGGRFEESLDYEDAMRTAIIFTALISSSLLLQAQAKKPAAHFTGPVPTGPTAIIDTTAGQMSCKLFQKEAPIGVENFIGLAEGTKDWTSPTSGKSMKGTPLYNGTIFHRVIPNFMIQGGDPAGTGSGQTGLGFGLEIAPGLNFDRGGRLAYANTGLPNSNGSQFFITEGPTPDLNGGYTIFGQCTPAAVILVKKIARIPPNQRPGAGDRPFNPVKINKITIVRAGKTAARPGAHKAGATTTKKKPVAAPK